MGILKRLFPKSVSVKDEFPFNREKMEEAIRTNRDSLALVENWIDEDAFKNSFFNYGVPDFLRKDINKPINRNITYTDLMVLISREYFDQLNYLEIGVSVGKNFFQLLNALPQARFTGFDIEEINPVIERELVFKDKTEWTTPGASIKKNKSSLKTYRFQQKEVDYLSADVWDENSWARLKGNKYNLIFSDALHTPEAILFEFEMLVKFGLLDEKFIIVWDDLVGKMKRSFFRIIRKYNKAYRIKEIYLLQINGWVGEHEKAHAVGIISSFNF